MCAATDSNSKKKTKQKSMLGYCNDILSRIVPSTSKSMLKTDAIPLDGDSMHYQIATNDISGNNGIVSAGNSVPNEHSMQLVQNNLNQANQNLTIIESQQNLHFNNVPGLHFGNIIHMPVSSSRKNSYNGSCDDRANHRKTKYLGK